MVFEFKLFEGLEAPEVSFAMVMVMLVAMGMVLWAQV